MDRLRTWAVLLLLLVTATALALPAQAAPAAPQAPALSLGPAAEAAPAPVPELPFLKAPKPEEKAMACGMRYFPCAQTIDGLCTCEGFECQGHFICGFIVS